MIAVLTCSNPMPNELEDVEEKRPRRDTARTVTAIEANDPVSSRSK